MKQEDIRRLIGEIAERHGVLLEASDPIFIAVTINELVLERFVRQVETALEVAQDQMTAQALQQRETAKVLAEQAIVGGAGYVANTARAAIDELRAAAADERAALRQVADASRRESQGVLWSVALLLAVAAGLGGFWLGAFELR